MKNKIDETRSLNYELELDATPEEVWRALSEGEEISKWFALDAKVTPGEGGSIWLSWGEGIEFASPIQIWEEAKHLRSSEDRKDADGTPRKLAVDYYLDALEGGKTRLRLVQSGFGTTEEWDDEFDAIRDGWKIFLRNLAHYLRSHRGKSVRHHWEAMPSPLGLDECWKRLSETLFTKEEEQWTLKISDSDHATGVIDLWHDGVLIGGSLENLGGALVRLATSRLFKGVEFHLLGYDMPQSEFETLKTSLASAIHALIDVK